MKNRRNCIIVHGCPDTSEEKSSEYAGHWMPWVRKQLIQAGIPTELPLMPTPWQPDYRAFKEEFEKCRVTKNTILIGHSCGCAFLVRWLGETKQKVDTLILVSPWKVSEGSGKYRKTFYEYPIDATIKDRVGKIVMFTSDNEELAGKKSVEIFHKALGGKIIELKGKGHYTLEDTGTNQFPELIHELGLEEN